ncbi:MAG: polyamine aminopropyltransferase [Legionellales bacterium]|nr:polyamine aminopropyltransferase [Legionellales bacterium]
MNIATKDWFTEECVEAGSAFSVKVSKKLHSETTDFQTIDIYETEKFGNMMVIDGFIMLTSRDNFIYHEMMAHSCLFSHHDPKNILIVGGGDCGTLQQVLKHPINSVTQVEIDIRVTELSKKYFPELCNNNTDSRANLIFEDAISWIKNASPSSIDAIIIDSTDPIGPGEGLFTEDFYKNCHNALTSKGVIIHQSESPFFQKELLSSIRKKMKNSNFKNVETIFFPMPTYPSGWWSATLASNNTLSEPRVIPKDMLETLKYYSQDIHKNSLGLPQFLSSI